MATGAPRSTVHPAPAVTSMETAASDGPHGTVYPLPVVLIVEADFTHLLEEWRAIASTPAAVVDGWDLAIEAIAHDEQRLRADGQWVHGRDDMFGVLKVERAEIRHSAMIAWLLDPCARHGLGTAFLERLLQRAFPEQAFGDLLQARPTCEVTRGDCRADIVVWMNDATIVVENKVDAEESPRQCDILYERFIDNVGARFVFLTPTGRAPTTATGDATDAFAAIGYGDVRVALNAALGAVRTTAPPWGRRAAEDYLRTLGRDFR